MYKVPTTSFALMACLLLLSACRYFSNEPTAFRASSGPALYDHEAYRWVNTCNGPIELNHALITGAVINNEDLTANCSKIGNLCIGGKVCLSDCLVTGHSRIGCTARIYDSEMCGTVCVGDDLFAQESLFSADVTVDGDVTARCTQFDGTLTAVAEIINLTNVCSKDIYVCPTGPYYDPQALYLKHGTVIRGNIYFPSCKGKVVMDCTCRIDGEIYGGNVIAPFDCYEDSMPNW